jgi:hypothetical protein
VGQFWTPIIPQSGSILHADIQTIANDHSQLT